MLTYEEGRYQAIITMQGIGKNAKNNPELQIRIKPTAILNAKGEPEPINATYERTIFLTLTEATIGTNAKPGWVIQTLRYLGWEGTSFATLDPDHESAFRLVGREIDAICQHNEYQGKTSEKWSIYRPGSGPSSEPMDNKGLRALDAKFKDILRKPTPKTRQTAPPATPATTTTTEQLASENFDEIPF